MRYVYAAILAQACNFGLTPMADIADLTYRQLAWTSDQYSQYGSKVILSTVRDATYVLD